MDEAFNEASLFLYADSIGPSANWKCHCGCGLVVYYKIEPKKVTLSSPLVTLNPLCLVFKQQEEYEEYMQDLYIVLGDECSKRWIKYMGQQTKGTWK